MSKPHPQKTIFPIPSIETDYSAFASDVEFGEADIYKIK